MKIIILHGFGSTSRGSSTTLKLMDIFGSDALPVTYDYLNPSKAEHTIDEAIQSLSDEDEIIIIGASLGGYWARYFANKYDNIRLVLLNPSIDAPTNVAKYYGQTFGGREVPTTLGEDLRPYYVDQDRSDLDITVVVGTNDTIVDPQRTIDLYEGRARVIVTDDEHRVNVDNLQEVLQRAVNRMF